MDYQLNTRLNGNIAMTSSYHERASLQRDKTLYKFIWVQSGTLDPVASPGGKRGGR